MKNYVLLNSLLRGVLPEHIPSPRLRPLASSCMRHVYIKGCAHSRRTCAHHNAIVRQAVNSEAPGPSAPLRQKSRTRTLLGNATSGPAWLSSDAVAGVWEALRDGMPLMIDCMAFEGAASPDTCMQSTRSMGWLARHRLPSTSLGLSTKAV